MSENYHPPRIRNIILGILILAFGIMLVGNLGEIVKWSGYVLITPLNKLGLLNLVSKAEITPIDLSIPKQEVEFGIPGCYALYTSNLDLLTVTDAVLEDKGNPWLKINNPNHQAKVNVGFVRRGLMVYDTPFAEGRPIYTFEIPSSGSYLIENITRPGAVGYFVRDYVTGNEKKYGTFIAIEILIICAPFGFWGYRHAKTKMNALKARQKQNRIRAEKLWKGNH